MLLSPSGVTVTASRTFWRVQSPPICSAVPLSRRRRSGQRGRGLRGARRVAGLAHRVEPGVELVLLRKRAHEDVRGRLVAGRPQRDPGDARADGGERDEDDQQAVRADGAEIGPRAPSAGRFRLEMSGAEFRGERSVVRLSGTSFGRGARSLNAGSDAAKRSPAARRMWKVAGSGRASGPGASTCVQPPPPRGRALRRGPDIHGGDRPPPPSPRSQPSRLSPRRPPPGRAPTSACSSPRRPTAGCSSSRFAGSLRGASSGVTWSTAATAGRSPRSASARGPARRVSSALPARRRRRRGSWCGHAARRPRPQLVRARGRGRGHRELRGRQLAGPVLAPLRGRLPLQPAPSAQPTARPALDAIVRRVTGPGAPAELRARGGRHARRLAAPDLLPWKWNDPGVPGALRRGSGAPARWRACACASPTPRKRPSGSDGHLTVVDQDSGWEYDFWQVRRKPRGGGRSRPRMAGARGSTGRASGRTPTRPTTARSLGSSGPRR